MGYDAAYEKAAGDAELARRARAEGRILVTRDRELANRRGLRTLLIHSEVLEEQVQEVVVALPVDPQHRHARCSFCNDPLEAVDPAEVTGTVPPYVLRVHTEFHRCPGCGRTYWPGSHFEAIQKQIRRFLSGSAGDS